MKHLTFKNVFMLILSIILFSLIIKSFRCSYIKNPKQCNILKNGFQVIQCFSNDEIRYMKHLSDKDENSQIKSFIHSHRGAQEKIRHILGPDYVFQDYIFLLKKSQIHTCHRDNNGDMYNPQQKHPSYTILFYLEPMERCLDVIDKSHVSKWGLFLTDASKSVPCTPGDAILFDANLYHSGSFNKKSDNLRIQMKISHKDDIYALQFYQGYNKILDKGAKNPGIVRKLQKHFTCQYPFLSDLTNDVHKGKEEQGTGSKIFSQIFYGDKNFYNLKNV